MDFFVGLIPKEHWSYPAFINQTQAAMNRKDMEERNVPYGESETYRHMCRQVDQSPTFYFLPRAVTQRERDAFVFAFPSVRISRLDLFQLIIDAIDILLS